MSRPLSGLAIGGPLSGQWLESPHSSVSKLYNDEPLSANASYPNPGAPQLKLSRHTYFFEQWPVPGRNGAELFGIFRHESLVTKADVMRELMTNYRPIQPVRI